MKLTLSAMDGRRLHQYRSRVPGLRKHIPDDNLPAAGVRNLHEQMLSRSSTLTPASGQLQVMIGTKIELYNKNKSGIIRWLSVLCHSLKEG